MSFLCNSANGEKIILKGRNKKHPFKNECSFVSHRILCKDPYPSFSSNSDGLLLALPMDPVTGLRFSNFLASLHMWLDVPLVEKLFTYCITSDDTNIVEKPKVVRNRPIIYHFTALNNDNPKSKSQCLRPPSRRDITFTSFEPNLVSNFSLPGWF